jgi:hypothetical protein
VGQSQKEMTPAFLVVFGIGFVLGVLFTVLVFDNK